MIARWFALSLALSSTLVTLDQAAAETSAPSPPLAALPPAPRLNLPKLSPPPPPPTSRAAAAAHVGAHGLRNLSDTFADIAEKVSPSVVQIDVTAGHVIPSSFRWLGKESVQRGLGSGVIFSSDGNILTNNHVIEEARSIIVRLRDGRTFQGQVVGRDPDTDLAVIRIKGKDLPVADFADSDSARVGEWVLAIGSPFGLGHTVTSGVLSAKGRGGVGINAVEDYLQTDASINPGNSGGPLINLDGKVLGINTMIVSRGQGIGLAVPASIARRVATQILKNGRVDRAYIGVGMQDLTPQLAAEIPAAPAAGALVNAVAPDSPASRSHLETGDIIFAIAGKPIRDSQDVIREVFLHNVGDTVTVDFVRKGKKLKAQVKLASRGDPPPPALPVQRKALSAPGLGLKLREVALEADRRAVLIAGVAQDSASERAGLKPGDLILEADGKTLPNANEVQGAAKDGHMLLRVQRRDTVFYAAVRN